MLAAPPQGTAPVSGRGSREIERARVDLRHGTLSQDRVYQGEDKGCWYRFLPEYDLERPGDNRLPAMLEQRGYRRTDWQPLQSQGTD